MPGMDIGKKGLEYYVGVMIFLKMNSENETVCKSSTWFWSQPSLYAVCHS